MVLFTLLLACFCLSLNRENIGIFLGNGSTEEFSRVPYSRVVSTPETASDATNFISTYVVSGHCWVGFKIVNALFSRDPVLRTVYN